MQEIVLSTYCQLIDYLFVYVNTSRELYKVLKIYNTLSSFSDFSNKYLTIHNLIKNLITELN